MTKCTSLEWLVRSLCALLLGAVPLMFSPRWYRYGDLKEAVVFLLGALALMAVLLILMLDRSRLHHFWQIPRVLRLPLLLVALWEMVSLLWAQDIQLGMSRVANDLFLIALLGVFYALGRRKANRSLFLTIILLTTLAVSLFSLAQKAGISAGLEKYYTLREIEEGTASFGNRDYLAQFLNATILLALGWLLFGEQTRKILRWIAAIACAISLQALLFTQSRAGYLAVLVTGGALILVYLLSKGRKPAALWTTAVAALVILANSAWLVPSLVEQFRPESVSNSFRLQAYPDALRMIAENPPGIGRGQTERVFRLYRTPLPEQASWARADHLHSDPLEWIAELGAPGALLALWLLWTLARLFLRSAMENRESLAWLAAAMGLLIHSLFSFPFHLPAARILMVASCALALPRQALPKQEPIPRLAPWVYPATVLAMVLIFAAQLRLGLIPMQVSRLHWEALTHLSYSESQKVLERAMALTPENLELPFNAGLIQMQRADAEKAKDYFQRYVDRYAANFKAWYNLGSAALNSKDLALARQALERSERLHPEHPPTLSLLGRVYYEQGELERAGEYFNRALELEPASARAQYNLAVIYSRSGLWEQALERCVKALEQDPGYEPAHRLKAQIEATLQASPPRSAP